MILEQLIAKIKFEKMNRYFLIITLIVAVIVQINAQEKHSKESRVKANAVPSKALESLESAPFDRKIKWYREESHTRISYEAKTKYQNKKYSIEFNSEGEIEDIEVNIKWDDIPTSTQVKIRAFLDKAHQKTKFQKVQKEYTGDTLDLLKKLKGEEVNILKTNYEIVLKAKTDNEHERLEYLFSDTGEMISRSKITLHNIDHLEH